MGKLKLEKLEERRKAAMARARQAARNLAAQQQHTLIAVGAAYAIGAAEERGIELPTVRKIDPKLLYGVATLAGGFMFKDKKARAIAQSVGDGLLSIVAYQQAKGVDALDFGGAEE